MKQELVEIFKSLLSSMSYFNAADSTWYEETEARNQTREELKKTAKNLRLLGIDPKAIADTGKYLVSESDYK